MLWKLQAGSWLVNAQQSSPPKCYISRRFFRFSCKSPLYQDNQPDLTFSRLYFAANSNPDKGNSNPQISNINKEVSVLPYDKDRSVQSVDALSDSISHHHQSLLLRNKRVATITPSPFLFWLISKVMDYADSLKLSIVDVQRLTVQDIRKKNFKLDLRHLSPWEREECYSFIR